MKVIDKLWFTNRDGVIGIVVIEEDVTGDRKAYIGIGEGKSEFTDTEAIVNWGNRFHSNTALRIERLLTYNGKRKETM